MATSAGVRAQNCCPISKLGAIQMSDALYAGIGAALLGLLGVLLTIRWNQQTHESNLSEERRKQREEREFAAKQDALMRASDAVIRFITYFVSIPDRDIEQGGRVPAEVIDFGIALNKLHFYCGIDAVEGAVKLARILNLAFSEAMKARIPPGFIAGEISGLEIHISNLERMNDLAQREILALLQSHPASALIASLREHLAANCAQLADLHAKRSALTKAKYLATEVCRDVVIDQLPRVFEVLRDLLVLARDELGFSIDKDRYVTLMTDHADRMVALLNDLMSEVRRQVAERMG